MAVIVSSFDDKKIDVMKAVAFLTGVQMYVLATITTAQNVYTDEQVLFFEFGDAFNGCRKREPGHVEGFYEVGSCKVGLGYVQRDIELLGRTRRTARLFTSHFGVSR